MNLIALLFAFEAGVMPMNTQVNMDAPQVLESDIWYAETQVEAQLFDNHLFIGGSLGTVTQRRELMYMNMLYGEYTFNAGFRFGPFEIGFRHYCGPHPFHTDSPVFEDGPYRSGTYDVDWANPVLTEHTTQEVYLRVEGSIE